jgi:hypothetical protein
MVSKALNTAYSTGGGANGLWRAIVQEVNGSLLSVTIPRLGQNNLYENVPYIGFTPQVGDRIWVGFIEGRSFEPVAFVGASDTSTDITEIVAGTNLNGGGSGGSITVNLDDDITLSTVTADEVYGDLHGAIHLQVKNVDSVALSQGDPVYATGAVGASGAIEVKGSFAIAASATMPAMGLLDQDLAVNGQGDVVVSGVLRNIDTDTPGYSVGDELYVAPSGGLTTTRPTASSDLVQKIGKVIRVQQHTGEILVQGAGRTNDVPNSFSTSGNVTVGGNLTVNGTTVTLNTETLTVEDNIILLNSNVTGTPSLDAGIQVERGSSSNVSFLWDESNDRWTLGSESLVAGTFIGGVEATTITASGDVAIDTDTLFVDVSEGRVGIGTTSPDSSLEVADGTLAQVKINDTGGTVGTDTNAKVVFDAGGSKAGHVGFNNTASGIMGLVNVDGEIRVQTNTADQILLRTNNSTRVTVTGTGDVGIGDTTPSYKLDVNGTGRFTDNVNIDTDLVVGSASSNGNATIQIMAQSGSYPILYFGDGGTNQWHIESTPSGGAWQFVESGVGYPLTILPGNRVGIGDTTPAYALDVAGDIRATGRVRTDLIGPSGGDDLGIGAGETANYMAGNISGEHLWLGAEGNTYIVTSPDNWASGWAGRDQTSLAPLGDGSLRVTTDSGYIDIGPKNTTYCHIYTDRGSFYFNKSVLYANSTSNKIWHAGNDGAGSGLDADLLDGNQASAFITTSTTQSNNLFIRNSSPTIYLRDTDHRAAMLHQNSHIFYVLRASGNDSTTWQTTQGEWPLVVRVDNNEVVAGGQVRVPNMDGTGSYNTCRYNTSNGHIMHFTSLAEHKTDIVEINGVLGSLNERSLLHDLRPILFHENQETATTRGEYIPGFIAEEVHEVAPELTYYDRNGELISYSPEALVPHLVAEIQRLNGMVEELYQTTHPDWTPPQPRPSDRGDDEKAVFDAGAAYTVANPVVIPPPNLPMEPEEPTE